MTTATAPRRFLRLRHVKEIVGLGKTTLYNRIKEGTFPKPVSLGGRAVGWLESEVTAWANERITESRGLNLEGYPTDEWISIR